MKINVDKNLCIGCGVCAALCPANFLMDENEGKALPIGEKQDCAEEAVKNCPMQAISLR